MRRICHLEKVFHSWLHIMPKSKKYTKGQNSLGFHFRRPSMSTTMDGSPKKYPVAIELLTSFATPCPSFSSVGGRLSVNRKKGHFDKELGGRWRGPLLSPSRMTATPSFSIIIADFFGELGVVCLPSIHQLFTLKSLLESWLCHWLNGVKRRDAWPFMRENLVFSCRSNCNVFFVAINWKYIWFSLPPTTSSPWQERKHVLSRGNPRRGKLLNTLSSPLLQLRGKLGSLCEGGDPFVIR